MTRKLFDNMMDVACFTSIICVPIAAIQMFWFPGVTVDGRPPSTFTNANYYGMDDRIRSNYCYVRYFYKSKM